MPFNPAIRVLPERIKALASGPFRLSLLPPSGTQV
jgi:hypothetical protein